MDDVVCARFTSIIERLGQLLGRLQIPEVSSASLWRDIFALRREMRQLTCDVASDYFGIILTDKEVSKLTPELARKVMNDARLVVLLDASNRLNDLVREAEIATES